MANSHFVIEDSSVQQVIL